jgi:large repetitive protein
MGKRRLVSAGFLLSTIAVVALGIRTLVATAVPNPSVSFASVNSSPFVGENFQYTVRFDNIGTSVGYGPYIDIAVPDHVDVVSMTYMGSSLSYQSVGVFPVGDPSCLTHPFARDGTGALKQICRSPNPGTNVRLFSVRLPFGSFVETQTVADIVVTASMNGTAPIGTPKTLLAQGGFYLGDDALDNPVSDPSFDSGFISTTVTPTVIRLTKDYIADYLNGGGENEINPGANNGQVFRIRADIANGATITNLVLADTLNATFSNVAIDSTSPVATSTSVVGNAVSATWASITGGTGSSDAVLNVRFEVPYRLTGTKIIDESAPLNVSVPNTATADGTYNLAALPTSTDSLDSNLVIKPIATQKNVAMHTDTNASGYTPGDTILYTVDTYVGDFQAVDNLVVTDILPDGLTYSGGSSLVSITANGSTFASSVAPSSSAGPGAGQTTLLWDFDSEGILRGGCVPVGGSGTGVDPSCAVNAGRTRVRITFRATINDTYINASRVEHRDFLNNTVSSTATAISPNNLAPTAGSYSDSSSAGITIVSGTFTKSIYAVNGSTSLPARLKPGDDVTYRLQYAVPSTDFTTIRMDDFLPLPMFTASQLTTFNAGAPLGTIPAAGNANFGTNETLYSYLSTAPTLSIQAGNVARFEWPATHDPSNTSRMIDIMFTVTINDAAYAPGMYITNQATVTENNIQNSFSANSIQQIELEIPQLSVTKGAVTSDNVADVYNPTTVGPVAFSAPGTSGVRYAGTISSATLGTNPIQSDVSDLDAGDIVTFALVVENEGRGDAFETRISDNLPAGLMVPGGGLNMNVSDGTGTSVAFTNVGGGSGLFDQGIQITPAINDSLAASGSNLIVITYDLEVISTAIANSTHTNAAEINQFRAEPAGVNYMNNQSSYTDSANVTLETASLAKSVTATTNADTTSNNVAVGEEITYTLTATIPEGRLNIASLVDTLDACLAVTALDSLTASSGVTATNGSFAAILAAATVGNVGGGAANNGRSITLNFGTIDNTNSSSGVAETITLVYRAVPINASTCARGTAANNSAVLTWDTTSTATVSATNVIVQEPTVTTAKTFTVAGGDADDVKTIQLVITASSGTNFSPAYNIVTTDDLTLTNFDYVGNIQHTGGVAPTTSGESGGVVTFTYNQLNPGQSSTVRFDVRIDQAVRANQTYPNTATTRYTSMLGTPSGLTTYNALGCERTGTNTDCGTTENDYVSNSTVNLTTTNVVNTKSLVATSEAHTAGSGVAIGEIVRYRLVSRIPEGLQTAYVLRDAIPNGMSYLNDGTTTAAFVYTTSFTSSTLTDPSLNFIGDETTVASVVPTYVLTGGAISAGPFNNGTDVDFNFGNITNTDNDATFEYIVVEFNALVRNEGTNTRGTTINNNFSTRINGAAIGSTTSGNVGVTIQEPIVAISKVVTTAPVDAGDPVVYTITLTNTAGTNVESGYEWTFTDALNTHLQFDSISNITLPGYATLDSSATAGQNVSAIINRLDPGDSASFRINATVRNTAPANFIVPNTGNVSVSSLPGTNGTTSNTTGSSTPGAGGTTTGERNTTGNSSVNTTLGTPSIDKQSPVAGSEYSIGQTITYPILVTVPEGVVQNVTITDSLPTGLSYESYSLNLTGFTGAFVNDPPTLSAPGVLPGASGADMVLDFGSISTPGTPGTTDSFVVNVTARVLDEAGNYEGQVLGNSATLTYTNPNTALPTNVNDGPVDITIREPRLSLNKTITAGDPRIVGDTLSYSVAITSDGSTTAYEWSLSDTLPAHTSLSGTPVCSNAGPVAISHSVTAGVLSISPNPLAGSTLPVGQTVTCTYNLVIASTAVAGTTYTNTADVDWRNSAASTGYGRVYADAVVTANDGTQDTDTANFTMEVIGITKSDNGRTTAVIGDTVNYTLTIGAPNATLADFVVTDVLPAGLIFNNDSNITGTGAVTPTLSGPNNGTAPTTVTWNFGTVSHNGTTITITYSARVANILSSQSGSVIANDAEVSFTPELSAPVIETSSDSFTVAEPVLNVTKSNDYPSPRFGDLVTFTIDVEHDPASNATARDITIVDVLPAGMTFASGSQLLPSGWSVVQTGQTLTFTGSALSVGTTVSISYLAEVTVTPAPAAIGSVLTNNLSATWTSLSGANANERGGSGGVNDYTDSSSSSVTIHNIELAITKNDQVTSALPGSLITYQIDYVNNGNLSANFVEITETVPDETVFNAAGSSPGWSCSDGSVAGTTCTLFVGSLGASATGSVDFAVEVLDLEALDRTTEEISNDVLIATDISDGIDALTSNNSDNEITPLQVADVSVTKTDSVDPVYLDHDYEYTITISNPGSFTATNLVIEDELPVGVSYRGYTSDSAVCTFVDPLLSCTLTALAVEGTEEIIVLVTGDTPGNKLNTVTVRHDQQDPDLTNNTDTENTFVDPADIELTKTADKANVSVGETIVFTVLVRNLGPDAATGTTVVDTMPSIFAVQSSTSTRGSCSGTSTITCVLGTMNNGQSETITITAKVTGTGTVTNRVSATINEYDPNPNNSTAVGVQITAVLPLSTTGRPLILGMGLAVIVLAVSYGSATNKTKKKH